MQVLEIDRTIIATEDVAETSENFKDLLDIEFGPIFEEDGMESAISRGGSSLDLVAPKNDGQGASAVQQFLNEGGPGLYALALRVDDVTTARKELAEKGIEPVYKENHGEFLEYFYHPKHFDGVFIALSEYPHSAETNILAEKELL